MEVTDPPCGSISNSSSIGKKIKETEKGVASCPVMLPLSLDFIHGSSWEIL
jgi:hypothetical protein